MSVGSLRGVVGSPIPIKKPNEIKRRSIVELSGKPPIAGKIPLFSVSAESGFVLSLKELI